MLQLEDPILVVEGRSDSSRVDGRDAGQHGLIIGAGRGSVKTATIDTSLLTSLFSDSRVCVGGRHANDQIERIAGVASATRRSI